MKKYYYGTVMGVLASFSLVAHSVPDPQPILPPQPQVVVSPAEGGSQGGNQGAPSKKHKVSSPTTQQLVIGGGLIALGVGGLGGTAALLVKDKISTDKMKKQTKERKKAEFIQNIDQHSLDLIKTHGSPEHVELLKPLINEYTQALVFYPSSEGKEGTTHSKNFKEKANAFDKAFAPLPIDSTLKEAVINTLRIQHVLKDLTPPAANASKNDIKIFDVTKQTNENKLKTLLKTQERLEETLENAKKEKDKKGESTKENKEKE